MSLTLYSYPVSTEPGKIKNMFPGYLPVLLNFLRRDIDIINITQGVNNTLLVTVLGDLTSNLNLGESVFIYSEGTNYTYNGSGELLDINIAGANTELTVNIDFIEIATGGYCNYLQDWLCEIKLVNVDNQNVKMYPAILADDGTNSGNVEIDVSIIVDLLSQRLKDKGGESTEGRIKFLVQFRESYREDREIAFETADPTPIIIVFSSVDIQIEETVNGFDEPIYWAGYKSGISFAHSDLNYEGQRLICNFDELDINKDELTVNNDLTQFKLDDYGFLFASSFDNPNFKFNNYSRYLRLNFEVAQAPDFDFGSFDSPDFQTT